MGSQFKAMAVGERGLTFCVAWPCCFIAMGAFILLSHATSMLSFPTLGRDGRLYACSKKMVFAFLKNGTIAWSVQINSTCNLDIAPVVDGKGVVYVAVRTTVICITPPTSTSKMPIALDFFSLIAQKSQGVHQAFSGVTGLAVSIWDSLIYINTGKEGLHAFMYDGTPLWSTHRQFNSSLMSFPESAASCATDVTECFFLYSPAIDQCDGSIYIARTDGWLYSIASWNPFLRWRYDFNVDGKPDVVGITAGSNSRVYVASVKQKMVYALVAETGVLIWQKEVGPLGTKSNFPVVDSSGWVSIGSLDGFLYVISPDGLGLKKYLSEHADSPFVIQTGPLLDCSGKAIFVAQLRVWSKRVDQIDGIIMVSFTNAWAVNIWMLVPESGIILWNSGYPGSFPVELLSNDLESYTFNSNWLLALAAVANLSNQSICTNLAQKFQVMCIQWLFNATSNAQYGGSRKGVLIFSLFVSITIPILIIVSILLYRWWSTQQNLHNLQLCETLRRKKFLQPQVPLQARRKVYHVAITNLQKRLKTDPESQELLHELGENLEGLHIVEDLLSQYLINASFPLVSDEELLTDRQVLSEETTSHSSQDVLSSSTNKSQLMNDVTDTYEKGLELRQLQSPMQIDNPLYQKSKSHASNYFGALEAEQEITLVDEEKG